MINKIQYLLFLGAMPLVIFQKLVKYHWQYLSLTTPKARAGLFQNRLTLNQDLKLTEELLFLEQICFSLLMFVKFEIILTQN